MRRHDEEHEGRRPQLTGASGLEPVLDEVEVMATLEDLLAQVEVRQVYLNREDVPIEAVYTFPVPAEAVLLSFSARLGERELAGRVMPAHAAENQYEEAVSAGDGAILLQEAAVGLYCASLGNLRPGEQAVLCYRYAQLQHWQGNQLRFALPTVVAPRYGDPLAAGLAPHQVPVTDLWAEHSLRLEVRVRGRLQEAELSCPTHAIQVDRDEDGARVRFAGGRNAALDRDVVLMLRRMTPMAASGLLETAGESRAGLLSLCPDLGEGESPEPRYVKILVDASGSMAGDSIAQAREALRRILDSLRPQDRFTLAAFGSTWRFLTAASVAADPAGLNKARKAVEKLDADLGGTELRSALLEVLNLQAPGCRGETLLITDGEVHDGQLVQEARATGERVFVVGVGCAPAEGLLFRLAQATGGSVEFVTPRDDVAGRIHRHFRRIYQPRVRELEIVWPCPVLEERRSREGGLYASDTVHVLARLDGDAAGSVHVRWTLEDGRSLEENVTLAAAGPQSGALPGIPLLERLLAAARLRAADESRTQAEQTELTALAVRCQLLSPWTSCLVVDQREAAEQSDGQPVLRVVPQMLAAGWHGMGTTGDSIQSYDICSARLLPTDQVKVLNRGPDVGYPSEKQRRRMFAACPRILSVSAPGSVTGLDWGSLAGLERMGLSSRALDELRQLLLEVHDEALLCLLMVHALLQEHTPAVLGLGRDEARRVRREASSQSIRPDLLERVAEIAHLALQP